MNARLSVHRSLKRAKRREDSPVRSDVNVCSTLTANIIIMYMISIQLDSYRLCRLMYVDRYMETGR